MRIERKIADWLVVRRQLRLRLHESETGMTTSVLKQDPNCDTSKVFQRMMFIRTRHKMVIFGGNPHYQLREKKINQQHFKQQLNDEK